MKNTEKKTRKPAAKKNPAPKNISDVQIVYTLDNASGVIYLLFIRISTTYKK